MMAGRRPVSQRGGHGASGRGRGGRQEHNTDGGSNANDSSSTESDDDGEDDDNSGDDNNDKADGNEGGDNGSGSGPRAYRQRGYSHGHFGDIPLHPRVIRIAENTIDSGPALRNLLSHMRARWLPGCITMTDYDRLHPEWWDQVIAEFYKYFTYDPKFGTKEEADHIIRQNLRNKVSRVTFREKERTLAKMAKHGGKYEDYRPVYYRDEVWQKFCEWWRSERFQKKSVAGKAARGKVKTPHTSGAFSFDKRRRDYKDTHDGVEPDPIEHFKDTHTYRRKQQGGMISKEAEKIVKRYEKIITNQGIDPKNTHLPSWTKAVKGPRKNRIVGFPHLKASDVLPPPPPPRKGEGSTSRSTSDRIRDDLFLRTVDQTVRHAREHPDEYGLSPEDVRVLASNILEGDSQLPQDHPLTQQLERELVRVIVEVLNTIYKTNGPGKVKGKGLVDNGGDLDNSSDDEDNFDRERTPPSSPRGSLRISG